MVNHSIECITKKTNMYIAHCCNCNMCVYIVWCVRIIVILIYIIKTIIAIRAKSYMN